MVLLFCAPTVIASHAQTFTTLVKFNGTNGADLRAGLVQATDGSFYGTTMTGGTSACGCGTIFKVTRAGVLTTLHTFTGPDGSGPDGALIQATNGSFYGTTAYGGASYGGALGYGTVFKITPAGALTTLHSFDSTDGANPNAGLVQAADGSFYGTTTYGGANGDWGTVFRITPGGALTTLHSFAGQDGADPFALIQASNGSFYGTTGNGGTFDYFCNGCGTIFKITQAGAFTTLYSFTGGTDGYNPLAGLVQATNGSFYGTTAYGGSGVPAICFSGCGTIFGMTPGGMLTTLYSFCAINCTDGAYPYAGLIQATDHNLYGTTGFGGAYGPGTVFKITLSGALTVLHSFDGTDGSFATAGLLQATDGNFYGTTSQFPADNCATDGCGTIFRLSVGLGPFVKTLPTSGKVGTLVKILGTNLTGVASVSFNGTAAMFTTVSPSLITTNVPTGATTGTVRVVTPGGTLSSNVAFLVRP